MAQAWVHVVVEGRCCIEVDGLPEPAWCSAGDVAVVTSGAGHSVKDALGTVPIDIGAMVGKCAAGGRLDIRNTGRGPRTVILCGGFSLEDRASSPLLPLLPPLLCGRLGDCFASWHRLAMDLVASDVGAVRPGSDAVAARLVEILVIELLRSRLAGPAKKEERGFLAALKDPRICKALAHIHANPASNLGLKALATRAAMSRASFCSRFRSLLGVAPKRYITAFRVQRAKDLLRATDASLTEVAGAVGYESDVAFNRAFKRIVGVPPGGFRRRPQPAAQGR
jgi:AraC-like DNA-binding protein